MLKHLSLALNDLKHEQVEQFLITAKGLNFKFMLPSARFRFECLKGEYFKRKGRFIEAYELFKSLEVSSLLPKESNELNIKLMQLYYAAGNLKACKESINNLQNKNLSLDQKLNCQIKQHELQMFSGEYQLAKDELEKSYGEPKLSENAKVVILHT
ncbi:MAG: hypothetical protein WDA74_10870, partial [Spirochaetota bacterium]